MRALVWLLFLAFTPPSGASFGERETTVDKLKQFDESAVEKVAEENARLRAEVANLRKRLHLPPEPETEAKPAGKSKNPPAASAGSHTRHLSV